jgi:hypothetical protein
VIQGKVSRDRNFNRIVKADKGDSPIEIPTVTQVTFRMD